MVSVALLADISGGTWGVARNFCIFLTKDRALLTYGMVLQLDFDVGKRDDGKVHVHAAVAQFDHLGGESRVCRFHIAVAGFVYQAEKVGFRQQEIIHGSVNFENYTLFSACAHEYNWQKTRQKIKNPTLNFTKCWISEV